MVPWCWEKKGRPCVRVCALGQGRRFACRQTFSHACSGSSRLVAFWLCRVMEVCHHHRAEKHGLEASGDRDLVVIRRELFPEQTLCGWGMCVYLECISSALFISDRGKKKNPKPKSQSCSSSVHMSASKGLRLIRPLWFAALGSCAAAPLLDGMEPSPGISLVLGRATLGLLAVSFWRSLVGGMHLP